MRTLWGWRACFKNPVRKWELKGVGGTAERWVFGGASVLSLYAVKNDV